ncbi:hypothetical protein Dimus_017847, partial [Dionaea muscipula]
RAGGSRDYGSVARAATGSAAAARCCDGSHGGAQGGELPRHQQPRTRRRRSAHGQHADSGAFSAQLRR